MAKGINHAANAPAMAVVRRHILGRSRRYSLIPDSIGVLDGQNHTDRAAAQAQRCKPFELGAFAGRDPELRPIYR
jgi:hypothetical protein